MSHIGRRIITTIVIVVLLALVGVFFLMLSANADSDISDFSNGWEVDFDGITARPDDISGYIFPTMAGSSDVITIRRDIPADISEDMAVRILVYLSEVDASVNGEIRYEYGTKLRDTGHFVGSGYHYIPIYPKDAGGILAITIRPSEDNAFSSIAGVAIMPSGRTNIVFAKTNVFSIFVSAFLVILGVVLLILSVVAHFAGIRKDRLFYIGCFSLLMGIWSMGSDKILQLFYNRYEVVTGIEYITLYMALIPFLALVINMRSDATRWKRIVLGIVMCILVIFDFVAILLHITDTAHFPKLLTAFHFLAASCVVSLIIAAIQPLKNMSRADRYLNLGILCLSVSGAIDIVRFNLQKYLLTTNRNLDASVLPFGVLAFIVLLIMSYLVFLFDEMIAQTEKRMLKRLAYEDPLTGLYNRTRCEERFEELKNSKENYAIINIDLNGLKHTNDTLGHAKGDDLIATFGGILKESFAKVGESFRMGGDEFLVIVPSAGIPFVGDAIKTMEKNSKEISSQKQFLISAAWGMAEKATNKGSMPEDIYKLADENMYIMKNEMKGIKAESH